MLVRVVKSTLLATSRSDSVSKQLRVQSTMKATTTKVATILGSAYTLQQIQGISTQRGDLLKGKWARARETLGGLLEVDEPSCSVYRPKRIKPLK